MSGYVSRGFHGKREADRENARVPPGQYIVRDFPVLSAGRRLTPPPPDWRSRLRGREPTTWSWHEFRALPSEDITADIHCVTQWSKLDTRWAASRSTRSSTRSSTSRPTSIVFSYGGLHHQPAARGPARRRRRGSPSTLRRRAAGRPSTVAPRGCSFRTSTSGRARSGSAASWLMAPRRRRGSGSVRLPHPRRPVARGALLRTTDAGRLARGDGRRARPETAATSRRIALDVPDWPGHDRGPARRRAPHRGGRLPGAALATRSRRRPTATRVALAVDGPARRRGVAVPGRATCGSATSSSSAVRSAATSCGSRRAPAARSCSPAGSGVVPLMAMLRHRHAAWGDRTHEARLLSSRTRAEDVIYRVELERSRVAPATARQSSHTLTRMPSRAPCPATRRRVDRRDAVGRAGRRRRPMLP